MMEGQCLKQNSSLQFWVLTREKVIEVKVISSDESVISSFIEDMRKFEV